MSCWSPPNIFHFTLGSFYPMEHWLPCLTQVSTSLSRQHPLNQFGYDTGVAIDTVCVASPSVLILWLWNHGMHKSLLVMCGSRAGESGEKRESGFRSGIGSILGKILTKQEIADRVQDWRV